MDTRSDKAVVVLLAVLAVIGAGFVFRVARVFLQPFMVAVLLSFILEIPIRALNKLHLPRFISTIIVMIMLLGVFFLIGLFIYSSINSFISQFPMYQDKFQLMFEQLLDQFDEIPNDILKEINWMGTVRSYLLSWSSSFMGFLAFIGLIVIYLVFILSEKPYFRTKLDKAFAEVTSVRIGKIITSINTQIAHFLTIRFFMSLLTGTLVWIILTFIGIDFPLIWGTLAFFFNFIPNIGSIFVAIITTTQAWIQFYPEWGMTIVVFIIMSVINLGIGNFLEPKLQGEGLNLSPLVVILTLLFWGWLWGVVGMLIAIPLTGSIKIICENIPSLHPISVILGTNPKNHN